MLPLFKIPKHCNKQQFIPKNYLWWHFFLSLSLLWLGVVFVADAVAGCRRVKLPVPQYSSDQRPIHSTQTPNSVPVSFEPFATLFYILISGIFYDAECRKNLTHAQTNKRTNTHTHTLSRKKVENFETMAQILKGTTTTTNDDDHDGDDDTENTIMQMDTKKSEWKHVDILWNRTRVKE